MQFVRGALGLGVLGLVGTSVALAVGVGIEGCISSSPTGPAEDSGPLPSFDGALPPTPVGDAAPDSTMPPSGGDGGVPDVNVPPIDGGGPDSAVPQALVRFGWFVDPAGTGIIAGGGNPGPLPSGYDVCIAPHGTQLWKGPLLASAGLATGLPPLAVSKYFGVPSGANDVLLLPPGNATCAAVDAGTDDAGNPILSPVLFTNLPPVPPGVSLTVGVVSSTTDPSGFAAVALVDETSANAGKVNARFASLAPGVGVASTFGLGGGVAYGQLFATSASQVLDPTADPNGYREIDPVTTIDLSLALVDPSFPPPNSNAIATQALALPAGTVLSAFEGATVSDGYSPILIVCFDGQTSAASSALTKCIANDFNTSQAAYSYTRFADFLADTTAPLDVCVRYQGTSAFAGPLFAASAVGADAGADAAVLPAVGLSPPVTQSAPTFSAVSGYFNIHGGFSYDVHFVPAGGTCAQSVLGVTDAVYASPVDPMGYAVNSTLALMGLATVPGDAGEPSMFDAGPIDAGPDASQLSPGLPSVAVSYATFIDESYSPSAGGSVRVVHAAALDPQPFDVLAYGPMGTSFPPVWTVVDMPYGGFGSLMPGVDGDGYQAVTFSGSPIWVNDTIGGGNEVQLYTSSIPAQGTATFFVYSYPNGGSPGVAFVQCPDSVWQIGGIFPCTFGNGG